MASESRTDSPRPFKCARLCVDSLGGCVAAKEPRIDVHIPAFKGGERGVLDELVPCVKDAMATMVMCMNRWRNDPARNMACWSVELRVRVITAVLCSLCCYGLDVAKTIVRWTSRLSHGYTSTLVAGDAALTVVCSESFVPTRWDILATKAHAEQLHSLLVDDPKFTKDVWIMKRPGNSLCDRFGLSNRTVHPLTLRVRLYTDNLQTDVDGVFTRTNRVLEKIQYLECYCRLGSEVPVYVDRARDLGFEVNMIPISSRQPIYKYVIPLIDADFKKPA